MMPRLVVSGLLAIFVLALPRPALAVDGELQIFGWVERIKLFDGELSLKAKLDSGAANSSLDATNIERFRRDGERFVRFTVTDPDTDEQLVLEKPLVRNVRIVRHTGEQHQRRPVVMMPICLGNRRMEVEVNLIDRSNFIYPMLLGRSAMRGFALIDSGETFMNPPRCSFD